MTRSVSAEISPDYVGHLQQLVIQLAERFRLHLLDVRGGVEAIRTECLDVRGGMQAIRTECLQAVRALGMQMRRDTARRLKVISLLRVGMHPNGGGWRRQC